MVVLPLPLTRTDRAPRPCVHGSQAMEMPEGVDWNGLVVGCYTRNSTTRQVGNDRAEFQSVDMPAYVKGLGYAVRLFDEQGRSGHTLAKRRVATGMLACLQAGCISGIGVVDLSRLTRDERGIDPAFIGDLLRRYAQGRLIVYGRVMDLRHPADWRLYRVLTTVAGWDRGDRNAAMLEGYKKAVEKVARQEREPWVTGPAVKLGYKRVPVLDEHGAPVFTADRAVRLTVAKEDADAEALEALGRALDREGTIAAVCRALNVAGVKPRGRWGRWNGTKVRRILADPLYYGEWRLMYTDLPRSEAWRHFEVDGWDPAQVVRHVPGLAWFDRARVERWRAKFLSQKGQYRTRKHRYLLLGITECAVCGDPLHAKGIDVASKAPIYKCARRERFSNLCKTSPYLTEPKMMAALRAILPDVLTRSADVVSAIWVKLAGNEGTSTEARLALIEEREQFIRREYVERMKKPPAWLIDEMEQLAEARSRLESEMAILASERQLRRQAAEVLNVLKDRPADAFDLLPPEGQAVVWRSLVGGVRFQAVGHARARKVWVDSYIAVSDGNTYYPEDAAHAGNHFREAGATYWLGKRSSTPPSESGVNLTLEQVGWIAEFLAAWQAVGGN